MRLEIGGNCPVEILNGCLLSISTEDYIKTRVLLEKQIVLYKLSPQVYEVKYQ